MNKRLLAACRKSLSPSLYRQRITLFNTGLRSSELRLARWSQVDLLKAEFQVGRSKTEGGSGRIIPLNAAALCVFQSRRLRWPDAKPTDYIFPFERPKFQGQGSVNSGVMVPDDVDVTKPTGSWRRAWATAKREAHVTARITICATTLQVSM